METEYLKQNGAVLRKSLDTKAPIIVEFLESQLKIMLRVYEQAINKLFEKLISDYFKKYGFRLSHAQNGPQSQTLLQENIKRLKSRKEGTKSDAMELESQPKSSFLQKIRAQKLRSKGCEYKTLVLQDLPQIGSRYFYPVEKNTVLENSEANRILHLSLLKPGITMTKENLNIVSKGIPKNRHFVHALETHKVKCILKIFIDKFGPNPLLLNFLSDAFGKSIHALTGLAYSLLIPTKKQTIEVENRRIFKPFELTRHFCNVCNRFLCTLHFETESKLDPDLPPYSFYNPLDCHYSTLELYFHPFRALENDAKDGKEQREFKSLREPKDPREFKIYLDFTCPKAQTSTCFFNAQQIIEPIQNIDDEFKSKIERSFIDNYCVLFGNTNPCSIFLLYRVFLGNGEVFGVQRTCAAIGRYLQLKHNLDPYQVTGRERDLLRRDTENTRRSKRVISKPGQQHTTKKDFKADHKPCHHFLGEDCDCFKKHAICEKYCLCSGDCQLRFSGCECRDGCKSKINCYCRGKSRECDPELCKCACNVNLRIVHQEKLTVKHCTNTPITYGLKPRIILGKSKVCSGLGVFAGETLEKNAYIGPYVGELLPVTEADVREIVYDTISMSYLFEFNSDRVIKLLLDAL